MSACPDKLLLLHALVDGALDAANSLALETHLRTCPGCADELGRIEALRARLAASNLAFSAPPPLASVIARDLAKASTPEGRPVQRRNVGFGPGRFAAGALTGLAAGVALMLALPQVTAPDIQGQLVASHVRSLQASHLIDVPASDRHIVKPWFNGRVDFAPPVPDLGKDGFPLAGGREDYVEGRTVAALVYYRRLHPINVFVRPAGALALPVALTSHHEGYNLVRWTASGLEYWAVSDLNAKELGQFRALFQTRAAG